MPPKRVVAAAVRQEDNDLCASFQEPTMLTDWVLPAFRIAREKRLYCCYVSNGYMTLEALRLLREAGMHVVLFRMENT
jgi:pyruvate formate lyase activating enzyme